MNKLHILGYQFLLLRFSFISQQKTHPNNGYVFCSKELAVRLYFAAVFRFLHSVQNTH